MRSQIGCSQNVLPNNMSLASSAQDGLSTHAAKRTATASYNLNGEQYSQNVPDTQHAKLAYRPTLIVYLLDQDCSFTTEALEMELRPTRCHVTRQPHRKKSQMKKESNTPGQVLKQPDPIKQIRPE